ncbi:hypothetical protein FQN60_015764 [Etheostoma spectabile]|uniref:Uncharacterized protein n=1 Tax=Etheostoma spectabile TaxID=54343 RepID=A0A5J5CMF9_9PERO|nr:hypothetical protein FQN60_015764 [Etheostoma spectabile]
MSSLDSSAGEIVAALWTTPLQS